MRLAPQSDLRDRPIVVLGSTGQVGFELLRSIQGLGRVHAPKREALDLAKLDAVRDMIVACKPAVVLNALAYTQVDQAETDIDAAMQVNAALPQALAEACARIGALLVHFSTDYVFDGRKNAPYVEEDAPNPLNVYGRSKLAGERAILATGGLYAILRTSWVYGARRANFLRAMLTYARERDRLRIVGDQRGAPTWCRSIAQLSAYALARSMSNGCLDLSFWQQHSGIYHLCASGETTWAGFARAIFERIGFDPVPDIEIIDSGAYGSAARPLNSRLSTARFCRVFGLQPLFWKDALDWCLEDLSLIS